MNEPPQPPTVPGGYPVVGHTPAVLQGPLDALQRWGQTEADLVRASVAGRQVCLVTAPDAIQRVLATDAGSYRKAELVRERLGTLQGGSLVLLEGDAWRERRGRLLPAFGGEQVRAAGGLTARYATETVEEWPAGENVRIDREIRTLSLAILARALFGLDLRGGRTPIHEAADDILGRLDPGSPSAYLPEWVPTPTNVRFRRAVARLHDRIDAVVAGESTDAAGPNLLSIMLAGGLEPEAVRDELIALLFAGFDSTATALSCTLGLLGDHPEIQADLRTELDAVVGEGRPTAGDLDDLPLLDAVVRESLRLYPPQYLLFREPVEAVELAGYRIAAGTTVLLSPWVTHRDPAFWEAPEEFRPQRWLDDGSDGDEPADDGPAGDSERPEFTYFPYGGGPRHCLGAGLANQTIRLVVAVLCLHRQLSLQGSLSVTPGPTLSPDPLAMRTFPDR